MSPAFSQSQTAFHCACGTPSARPGLVWEQRAWPGWDTIAVSFRRSLTMFRNKNQIVEVFCNWKHLPLFHWITHRMGWPVFSFKKTEELKLQILSCLHFKQKNVQLCTWITFSVGLCIKDSVRADFAVSGEVRRGEERESLDEGEKNIKLILYLDLNTKWFPFLPLPGAVLEGQQRLRILNLTAKAGLNEKGEEDMHVTVLQILRIQVFNNKCSFKQSPVEQIN